jgi:hypothetical protein
LECAAHVTLTLPALRSDVEVGSPLEWDKTTEGGVRFVHAPVCRFEKQVLFINTVFLFLAAPRFLRMHILRSLETQDTVDGTSWVLPYTTRSDVSIVETVKLKRRPRVFLTVRNPVFISHSKEHSANILAGKWVGVLMHSAYESAQTDYSLSSYSATAAGADPALSVACKEYVFDREVATMVKNTDACIKEHIVQLGKKHPEIKMCQLLTCQPTTEYVSLNTFLTPDDEAFLYAEMPNIVAGLVDVSMRPSAVEKRLREVLSNLNDTLSSVSGSATEDTPISKILQGCFPDGFGQVVSGDSDKPPSGDGRMSAADIKAAAIQHAYNDTGDDSGGDYYDYGDYDDDDDGGGARKPKADQKSFGGSSSGSDSIDSPLFPVQSHAPGSVLADITTTTTTTPSQKRKQHRMMSEDASAFAHRNKTRVAITDFSDTPVIVSADYDDNGCILDD